MQQKRARVTSAEKKMYNSISNNSNESLTIDYRKIYQRVRQIPPYDMKNCWVRRYRTQKQRYQQAQRNYHNQHLNKGQFKDNCRSNFRSRMLFQKNLKFGVKLSEEHLIDLQKPHKNYNLIPFAEVDKSKWISDSDFKVKRVCTRLPVHIHDFYRGGYQQTGDIYRHKDISKNVSAHQFVSAVKSDPIGCQIFRSTSLRTLQNSIFFNQKQAPIELQHYKKHTKLQNNVLPYQHSQNYKHLQLKKQLHKKQPHILNNSVSFGLPPRVVVLGKKKLNKNKVKIQYPMSQKRLNLNNKNEDVKQIIKQYFD